MPYPKKGECRNTGRTRIKKGQRLSPATEFKKGNIPHFKLHPELVKRGKDSPAWKGGRRMRGEYVCLYSPEHPLKDKNNLVAEHRLVIEKHIGRYLKLSEHCHHLNKIKTDNRPENLMAFKTQSAHNKFEFNIKIKTSDIIFDGRKINLD